MKEPIEVTERHVSIFGVSAALVNWFYIFVAVGTISALVGWRFFGMADGWIGVVMLAFALAGIIFLTVAFSRTFSGLYFGEVYAGLLFIFMVTAVFPFLRTGVIPLWLRGQSGEQAIGVAMVTALFSLLNLSHPYLLVENWRQELKRKAAGYFGVFLLLLLVAVLFGDF